MKEEQLDLNNLKQCQDLIYEQQLEITELQEHVNRAFEVNIQSVQRMAEDNKKYMRCVDIMTKTLTELRGCNFENVYSCKETVEEVMNRSRKTLLKVGLVLKVGK